MTPAAADPPTRERIVAAATGMFRRVGVAGAGIGEICRRAGVTKGVFSHHFPGGKEQLVLEVVRRNRDDVAALLGGLTAAPPPSRGELVAAAFAGYAGLLRERGVDFGCPVAASVVDVSGASPPVRAAAGESFRAWADLLDAALGPPSDDLALLVVAALEGGILLARGDGDPEVLDRIGAALAALVELAALVDTAPPGWRT